MAETFNEEDFDGEIFLVCAARVAETIENLDGQSEVMSLLALRCAELGLLEVAARLAESIPDPYSRDQALANVAAECIAFDEADFADELVAGIEDPGINSVALEQRAVKYAEAGAFDKALEVAHDMDDGGPALSRIAFSYMDAGLFAEASDVARSIADAGLQATTLIELAARHLRAGRQAEGAELLPKAEDAAEEIEFTQEHVNALTELASLYAETGEEERTFELLSRALRLCEEFEGAPYAGMAQDYSRDESLARIAVGLARLRRYDRAEKVLEEIENPFQFASAQADVALEYHRAGQSEEALKLLADALEVVKEEEAYGQHGAMLRESLLAKLAASYASSGRPEDALQIAGTISAQDIRYGALRDAARTLARAGSHGWVFRAAETIHEIYPKVIFDLEAHDILKESDQPELAEHALSQALADAERMERPFEKALALTGVAARYRQREEAARASGLLFDALNTTALMTDNYRKARALIELDGEYRKAGQAPGEREQRVLEEIAS